MWKFFTNSNLILSLKLFFYSPILTNNNLLLKIYCENIVVTFLKIFYSLYYFSFINLHFIHTFFFSFFLFFFSCFSPPHVVLISIPLLLFALSPSFKYVPGFQHQQAQLSFSSALSLFLFFFIFFFNLIFSRVFHPQCFPSFAKK